MRRPLLAAAAALCLAAPAGALDLEAMTPAERAAFGDAVRAYLLENPEVLREAIDVLDARDAAAQAAADTARIAENAEALFADDHSWVGGNPEGDITVVEFLDYRCGYCRRAHPEVLELVEGDGNIRYVVKEFPILGPESVLASRFAVATLRVAGDEAYKAVNDALMTMRAAVTEAGLERLADTLELDAPAIMAEMNSDAVTQILRDNRALAETMQISGTPSFVMGDTMLRGYLPLAEMQAIVAEAREEG